MIQSSPSAMMPIGAMCTLPAASAVVTIASRIIGMSGSGEAAEGVPDLAEAGEVFRIAIDRATPIERLVLRITLAQAPRDFRFHQLGAEIEGMRRVVSQVE